MALALSAMLGQSTTAAADPVSDMMAAARPSADGSKLADVKPEGGNRYTLQVYSAAMDRNIEVHTIRPANTSAPRPVLYLLNGAGGGVDTRTWEERTDLVQFMADKNVNVVIPVGGQFSYYTDWLQNDPMLGRNKWTTFLTEELPPVINSAFATTGVNAIAGLSMAGSAVLALAEAAPDLYKAVGSYSGCAETSTPLGQQFVKLVVESRGGGKVANMWGPSNSPDWAANDAYKNAEKLRGKALYIASGTGLPGPNDTLTSPGVNGNPIVLADQLMTGGVIEAAVNMCTHNLANRLNQLQIPATFDFTPTGTHSWGYWQDDLHNSWPMIAKAIGA
ncbi:esterase family protein [Skermania sp. ID1734]|nr:esterase family protein [Skermania sp. ID1734]